MDRPRRSRIEDAAALAEIISAVAVVVSLIYVASEIRQNTMALQESNAQVVLTLGQAWTDWDRDQDFAAAVVVAYENPSELTAAQRRQVSTWMGRGLDVWESAFSSREKGLMTDELFEAWDAAFVGLMKGEEIWRLAWTERRHGYHESFRVYVDGVVAQLSVRLDQPGTPP
jgi:opacity protein-like surface antigen